MVAPPPRADLTTSRRTSSSTPVGCHVPHPLLDRSRRPTRDGLSGLDGRDSGARWLHALAGDVLCSRPQESARSSTRIRLVVEGFYVTACCRCSCWSGRIRAVCALRYSTAPPPHYGFSRYHTAYSANTPRYMTRCCPPNGNSSGSRSRSRDAAAWGRGPSAGRERSESDSRSLLWNPIGLAGAERPRRGRGIIDTADRRVLQIAHDFAGPHRSQLCNSGTESLISACDRIVHDVASVATDRLDAVGRRRTGSSATASGSVRSSAIVLGTGSPAAGKVTEAPRRELLAGKGALGTTFRAPSDRWPRGWRRRAARDIPRRLRRSRRTLGVACFVHRAQHITKEKR